MNVTISTPGGQSHQPESRKRHPNHKRPTFTLLCGKYTLFLAQPVSAYLDNVLRFTSLHFASNLTKLLAHEL